MPRKSSKVKQPKFNDKDRYNAMRLISAKVYHDYLSLIQLKKSTEVEHYFESWVKENLPNLPEKEQSILWRIFMEMLFERVGH